MCMNKSFVFATTDNTREYVLKLLDHSVHIVPILDKNHKLVDVVTTRDFPLEREKQIVIRARSPVRISFGGGGTDLTHYFVKNDVLVLGPFQGPVACTRISYGKGVCGAAWKEQKTIIVPDVEKFPGHIACSSLSKSEIVLPGFKNGAVNFIIDVDSELLNDFNKTDEEYLQNVVALIEKLF